MPQRRTTPALVRGVLCAVAALLVVSCSTDYDGVSDAPASGPSTTPTTVTGPVETGSSPNGSLPDPRIGDTTPDTDPPVSGLGTCNVQVTGGVTTTWSGSGGDTAVAYGPWFGDDARNEAAANSIVLDESYFLLSCTGPGGASVSFSGRAPIPQRPGTYRLTLGPTGQGAADRLAVAATIDGGAHTWQLGGEGKVTIETLDDTHVAGTFDLPLVAGDDDALTAHVTGSFDFPNPLLT